MRNIRLKLIFSTIIFLLLLYSYQSFIDLKTIPYDNLNNESPDNSSQNMNSFFLQFNNYGTKMLFIEDKCLNDKTSNLIDLVYLLHRQINQITSTIFNQVIFLNLYESVNIIAIIGTVNLDQNKGYELRKTQKEHSQSRIFLLSLIEQYPGIILRELQRKSGLAMGVTQYHMRILENINQVETFELGKCKHFFLKTLDLSISEKLLISSCVNTSVYIILKLILEEKILFQKDLVQITGYSKSLISYYTKILKHRGIIDSNKQYLAISNEFQRFLSLI